MDPSFTASRRLAVPEARQISQFRKSHCPRGSLTLLLPLARSRMHLLAGTKALRAFLSRSRFVRGLTRIASAPGFIPPLLFTELSLPPPLSLSLSRRRQRTPHKRDPSPSPLSRDGRETARTIRFDGAAGRTASLRFGFRGQALHRGRERASSLLFISQSEMQRGSCILHGATSERASERARAHEKPPVRSRYAFA